MKKFLGKSIVYFLGDFVIKGPEFLLVPIYTRFMAFHEYGALVFITALMPLARYFLGYGIQSVAMRFYFEFDEAGRKNFFGCVWLSFTVLILATYAVIFMASGPILHLLGGKVSEIEFLLLLTNSFMLTTGIDFFRETLRARGKALHFSSLNILLFGLSTALTIAFFVFYQATPLAALVALNIASLVIWIYCVSNIVKSLNINFNTEYLKQALIFGLPMVPHLLSHWVLNSSDKLFLGFYLSLEELAAYNVAFVIGWSLSLFKLSITNSLVPLFGELKRELSDTNKIRISKAVTLYVLVLFFIGSLLIINTNVALIVVAPDTFSGAAGVVPLIVCAALLLSLYNPTMLIMNVVVGNSKVISFTTLTSMSITILSAIIIIPFAGIYGAAISLVCGYLYLCIKMYINAQRHCYIPYDNQKIILIMVFYAFLALTFLWSRSLFEIDGSWISNVIFSLIAVGFFFGLIARFPKLVKWS